MILIKQSEGHHEIFGTKSGPSNFGTTKSGLPFATQKLGFVKCFLVISEKWKFCNQGMNER
jgi:hypothetical protein